MDLGGCRSARRGSTSASFTQTGERKTTNSVKSASQGANLTECFAGCGSTVESAAVGLKSRDRHSEWRAGRNPGRLRQRSAPNPDRRRVLHTHRSAGSVGSLAPPQQRSDEFAGRPRGQSTRTVKRRRHLLQIRREERSLDIVAAEARGLGEVVGAKLKNSAASAICPAVSAARGSSIIVPIGNCSEQPCASATDSRTPGGLVDYQLKFLDRTDKRTMISARGSPPIRSRKQAASAIARTWSANNPGSTNPRRTPRAGPTLDSIHWSLFTAWRRRRSDSISSPRSSARATRTASSVRSGRTREAEDQ